MRVRFLHSAPTLMDVYARQLSGMIHNHVIIGATPIASTNIED